MILKPNIRQATIIEEKAREVVNDPSYTEADKESMREIINQFDRQ